MKMKKSLAPIREAAKRVQSAEVKSGEKMYSKKKGRGATAPLRICLHISLASTRDQRSRVGRLKVSLQMPNLPRA
jgi:hypothetical protein